MWTVCGGRPDLHGAQDDALPCLLQGLGAALDACDAAAGRATAPLNSEGAEEFETEED